MPDTVYIGLGSNLGDRLGNCELALEALGDLPGTEVIAVSPAYETEPVGVEDQPPFINMACAARTGLEPGPLMAELLAIEKRMGRKRLEKWGPRTIDLDILLFGDRVIREDDLIVPHPQMHHRSFVLMPLAQIAREAVHPVLGLTVAEMLEALGQIAGIEPFPSRWG